MSDPQVLVVDDERNVRALLVRWLTGWRYRVREAGSALEAIDAMTVEPVNIVVSDVGLPDHDGLWLADQLQTRWPATAIIMASGRDEADVVRASRTLGAMAYVLKPFDPYVLRQALDRAAGRLRFRPSGEPCTGSVRTSLAHAEPCTPHICRTHTKITELTWNQ
jgi:CheY-like chemotaxis protein